MVKQKSHHDLNDLSLRYRRRRGCRTQKYSHRRDLHDPKFLNDQSERIRESGHPAPGFIFSAFEQE
jgi:hypothetical protein